MEERLIFSELPNIESYMAILGLVFNDNTTEFQKSFLTLAFLCASARDYVLKGQDIPQPIISLIYDLSTIIRDSASKQR